MAKITVPIQVNLPDDWVDQIINRLRNDPDADWVEVIRCKDCIYFHPSYCEIWSKFGTVQTREQGYCYMAERRTDEDDRC